MIMQWMMLVIVWMVFGLMAVVTLSLKKRVNQKILGVVFSGTHGESEDVQKVLRQFTRACYTILVGFAVASLLLFLPALAYYEEVIMLTLLVGNVAFNLWILDKYQRKLRAVKEKNHWVYSKKRTVNVNLSISKEKGKGALSPLWVWLFFALSFLPFALWAYADMREIYPIWAGFLGPIIQGSAVWNYYIMKNRSGLWHEKEMDERENIIFVRREERINTTTATWMAFIMLIFWFFLTGGILFDHSGSFMFLAVVVFTIGLFSIGHRHQNKLADLEDEFFGKISGEEEPIEEKGDCWKWGFYSNPSDPGLFVPKLVPGMGMTINMAHPGAKAILAIILIPVVLIIGIVLYSGQKDYSYTMDGHRLSVEAAMYDTDVEKEEIAEITTIKELPSGTRTGGYGGSKKSFGNFHLEGYGAVKLYSYNDVPIYVVIGLKKSEGYKYVILNEKTVEKTEALADKIMSWWGR